MERRRSGEDIGWLYVWQPGGYWLRYFMLRRVQFEMHQKFPHVAPLAFRLAEPSIEPPEMVRC